MNKILFLTLTFILFGCVAVQEKQVLPPAAFTKDFPNTEGCFLLYNMKTNAFEKVLGGERCHQQFSACSTFKVPLAVMAFDAGVLKNENMILKWDGKKELRPESNKDHQAKTWMRDSIVWFSQRITTNLGKEKFQNYLDKFNYGNRDQSGGLTQAWLVSPASQEPALKISAYQQVEFVKKLWTSQLPASPRSMQLAREITYLETSPKGYLLSGKTGSNFYDQNRKVHFGWFISHLQKGDEQFLTVMNFSDLAPTEAKGYGGLRAKEMTKQLLIEAGLW